MKKVLFPLLALVLALGLALPMAAVVGAADGDPIVYGMQRDSATIYPINPLDGTVGTPINTGLTPSSAGPNGLAYDSDNDDLYYTTYAGPATLYYWDIGVSVSSTMVGALGPGHVIADADFYDGKYYYINSGTDDLYEVAVSGGVISGTNSYLSISGDAHAWTWGGDIAISPEGVIYAVGNCTKDGHVYEFFKVNLDGTGFAMIDANVHSFSLQLAFGLDGKLYGHESKGSGNFYEINLTNGDLSSAFPNSTNYLYTDCASGPRASVEEPEISPRTIGYWGNWDNHYSETEMAALLAAVEDQSTNIRDLGLGVTGIHDFLLGKPHIKPKDGKRTFALFLMEKQFLAAWFNVKSYEDWVGDYDIPVFPGSPNAAMDPDATVDLSGDAATLFGSTTPTVRDILTIIEANKDNWEKDDLLTAKDVLDDMNNAENNG